MAPADESPVIERSGSARGGAPEVSLKLQTSEAAVLQAASNLYAAYITAGTLTNSNEGELMNKSVRTAIQLAVLTDRLVQSDDEEW